MMTSRSRWSEKWFLSPPPSY